MINFGQESDPAPLYVDDEASIDLLANFRSADRLSGFLYDFRS